MAAIEDRTEHNRGAGDAGDPGAPLNRRTATLFAGMVLTGSVTALLIASAVASLLAPAHQIGERPYLVSSLPAVLMLFVAIVPALWCAWFWRRIFPAAERPGRPAPARRRAKQQGGARPRRRTRPPAADVAAIVPEPPGATPLACLRLPKRVHRTLSGAGIETVEELTSRTQAQVLDIRGIGASSLNDILAALDRAGRALRRPRRVSRAR